MYEYKRIYVAVDGSKESDYAFRKAVGICKRNPQSTLIAIHVIDTSYAMNMADVAIYSLGKESREYSEKLESYYGKIVQQENIPFEMKMKEGSPTSTLLKEFKALNPDDLVVCGSSNISRIGKLLLGSISKSIVGESACDVLVVKTPEYMKANESILNEA